MNGEDISIAKDPEVRGALAALRRAGEQARETAIRTDLIIVEHGRMLRVAAAELCERGQSESIFTD